MRRRFPKRESLAVNYRRNRGYMNALISEPAQRERFARNFPESRLPPLPKKRGPIGQSGKPLERDIQAAILEFLVAHPLVVFAGRFNRGAYADGERYIRFNTVPGFPDIHGLLKGGRALYVEVKRDARAAISDEQQSFIMNARETGAIALLAWNVEQVADALK